MQIRMNNKELMLEKKLDDILDRLRAYSSAAIAFSGGVDSTFLLAAAKKAGLKKLMAVTVACQFVPLKEVEFAEKMAKKIGVELKVLEIDILKNQDVVRNSAQRCYYCKKEIFTLIKSAARASNIEFLLHAVNLDDLSDYRPGLKAAEELGFFAPLAEAGFSKKDIRRLSKEMKLETWDKPSQSCLAARIPYGVQIHNDDLIKVDEAERFLRTFGFDQLRVRCHKNLARIEVEPEMISKLFEPEIRRKISTHFSQLGFAYTSVDIDGYKTGKMNDEIL